MEQSRRADQKEEVVREEDAWRHLQEMLDAYKYMRFSVSSYRNAKNEREWEAVIFMETGRVLARATAPARAIAMVKVVKEMQK